MVILLSLPLIILFLKYYFYRALDLLHKNSANSPWSLRMETLRTLGLLGALEPLKYSLIQNHLHNYEKKKERKVDEEKIQPIALESTIHNGLNANERKGTITERTERTDGQRISG